MKNRGHYSEETNTGELAERLKIELKQVTNTQKRVSLFHALARLFENRSDDVKDETDYLEEALKTDKPSLSLYLQRT